MRDAAAPAKGDQTFRQEPVYLIWRKAFEFYLARSHLRKVTFDLAFQSRQLPMFSMKMETAPKCRFQIVVQTS